MPKIDEIVKNIHAIVWLSRVCHFCKSPDATYELCYTDSLNRKLSDYICPECMVAVLAMKSNIATDTQEV